jgi:hypothetical protein
MVFTGDEKVKENFSLRKNFYHRPRRMNHHLIGGQALTFERAVISNYLYMNVVNI